MKRPQHITITSIKYLISYPINMKVSNQVFTTSNSNKCVGGLCSCLVFARERQQTNTDQIQTTSLDLEPTFYTLTHPSWSLTYWFISYFLIYVTVPGWCLLVFIQVWVEVKCSRARHTTTTNTNMNQNTRILIYRCWAVKRVTANR